MRRRCFGASEDSSTNERWSIGADKHSDSQLKTVEEQQMMHGCSECYSFCMRKKDVCGGKEHLMSCCCSE